MLVPTELPTTLQNATLCEPGSGGIFVRRDATLSQAIEWFQKHSSIRLLPVVDDQMRPVGAILEQDIKGILFNPYGHSLLKNPNIGSKLDLYTQACPIAEASLGQSHLLECYAKSGGANGLIVTHQGKYVGVVSNNRLIQIAANREAERIERMSSFAAQFEAEAAAIAKILTDVSGALNSAASDTVERANQNSQSAESVAAATTQVTARMTMIADDSRGLASALEHLHTETISAKTAAEGAVILVTQSSKRTEELVRSAQSIEAIIAPIQSLASKVHLLALNATIEASRAGTTGHGFTVVAQEIKSLAKQTRSAARQIADQISEIHTAVDQVAIGHSGIEKVIEMVDAISHSLDGAVEAQTVMTRNVADNIDEAAMASKHICKHVFDIRQEMGATISTSDDVQSMAQDLHKNASHLRDRVANFVQEMRSA